MKISNFSNKLNLEPLFETEKELMIEGVYIGDLLSIVMAKAKKNYVWITIQTHINVIAVAELLDLSCIIIVENMDVEEEVINKAKELNISVFKTKESAYDIAAKLFEIGIK